MGKYKRLFVINEPTSIRISPSLAEEIGLNESIVLLQVEFWISISDNEEDGKKWTYQSTREMQRKAFPFWSISTINRAVNELIKNNYLIEANYNKHKYDKTRWFALGPNLANLNSIRGVEPRSNQNDTPLNHDKTYRDEPRSNQNEPRSNQNDTTIPEITTETTTETIKPLDGKPPSCFLIETDSDSEKPIKDTFNDLEKDSAELAEVNFDEEEFPPAPDIHLGHLAKDSKRKNGIDEKFKEKEMSDIIARHSRERVMTKGARESVINKKVRRSSVTIIAQFLELYKDHFGGNPLVDTAKNRTLLSKMIEHFGYDTVEAMVNYMFKDWAKFKRSYGVKSTCPEINVLWGWKNTLYECIKHKVDADPNDIDF